MQHLITDTYLRHFLFLFFIAAFANSYAQCYLVPVTLQERVANASIVIEGRVVAKKSAWNADHTLIETHHIVEIYKVFKGEVKEEKVTVTTQGGIVGEDMLKVSSSLKLNVGDVGIFTLVNNNSRQYFPYAAAQGFIQYDEAKDNAKSVFDAYATVTSVYDQIEGLTSLDKKVIKKYDVKSSDKSNRGEATPVISGLSPTIISAGTYSLLTITGTDFGNAAGSVEFPDADNGGATFITADPTLTQSWSDTEITIYVPTGATTGNIRVTNSTAETGTSSGSVTVTYNISGLNSTFQQTADYTPDLINDNGSGGYTFTFNNNYFLNTNAVSRYDEVIEQWRCESGINWGSNGASTTATSCEGSDGINLVTFDDVCGLPAGVLGTAYSFYNACGIGGVAYWRVSELDIKFDLGTNWNYTLASPSGAQFDFYSVMLHEMGHVHQLGHTPVSSDVMYFSISNGVEKRTLNANNIDAVNFIMSRNNANELAYNGSTGGSVVANACSTGPMIINGCNIPPTSAFTADNTSTCSTSLAVNFTDQSTGAPTSWDWDFGDGVTSSNQNPSHTYTTEGGFDVTLTTSNANGNNSLTVTSFITVGGSTPVATICDPASQNNGNFGQTISNVTFVSINNTTSTIVNEGYTDLSCDHMTAVESEMTYDLSVTLSAVGPNGDEQCFVYIDYNNNGDFEVSERVMNVTQPTGSSGTFTTPVTIPASAVVGTPLRMRVVGEANTLNGPCENNFIGDVEDYGIYINTTPLPITLSQFYINKWKDNKAQISWQTTTETNNDFFTIERSKDASNWETIKRVTGAGNSSVILNYNEVDAQPYAGLSYYRLKQTDYDGRFSYSDIRSLSISSNLPPKMILFPNPNDGISFQLLMSDISINSGRVIVTDVFGRVVFSQQISDQNNNIVLEEKLTKGYYLVNAFFGDQQISKTLVVK